MTIAVVCKQVPYGPMHDTTHSYTIERSVLPCSVKCRDLGIIITRDLSPSQHIHAVTAKAHQRAITVGLSIDISCLVIIIPWFALSLCKLCASHHRIQFSRVMVTFLTVRLCMGGLTVLGVGTLPISFFG